MYIIYLTHRIENHHKIKISYDEVLFDYYNYREIYIVFYLIFYLISLFCLLKTN